MPPRWQFCMLATESPPHPGMSMPSYPLYRQRNGTSALASTGLRCSGQHSISFYRLTVHIRAPIREGAPNLRAPTGGLHRQPAPSPLWYHNVILAFPSGRIVILLNKFSFICTHRKTKRQQQKRKNTLLEKKLTLSSRQRYGWELTETYWWQVCSRNIAGIKFLFDSCDRWQCKMATKGKRRMLEWWDCEGLGSPCQKPWNEHNGSSGFQETHSPLQRACFTTM